MAHESLVDSAAISGVCRFIASVAMITLVSCSASSTEDPVSSNREAPFSMASHIMKLEARPARVRPPAVAEAIRGLLLANPGTMTLTERALLNAMPGEIWPLPIPGNTAWNQAVDQYVDAIDKETPGYKDAHIAYVARLSGGAGTVESTPQPRSPWPRLAGDL